MQCLLLFAFVIETKNVSNNLGSIEPAAVGYEDVLVPLDSS